MTKHPGCEKECQNAKKGRIGCSAFCVLLPHKTMESKNPFQIQIPYNHQMDSFEMHLQVGNLSEQEAKQLADAISDWLIDGNSQGWKSRVQ